MEYKKKAEPKLNLTLELGVKAIIENPQGSILAVKDATSGNWTLPGGRIKMGETPLDALIREVEEEVKLRITKVGKPTSAWFFFTADDPNHQIVLLDYRYQVDNIEEIKLGKEVSAFAWVSPQEFLNFPLPHESLKYAIAQEYRLSLCSSESRKLVRDKIPVMVKKKGERIKIKKLTEDEYFLALLEKLKEEAQEAASAKTGSELIAELADILEVIETILKVAKIPAKEIKGAQKNKRKQRGGFDQRLSFS